jgi:hypothetical protein
LREALIDTDILSEIMEGKNEAIVRLSRQYYRVFRRYTVSASSILVFPLSLRIGGSSDRDRCRKARPRTKA